MKLKIYSSLSKKNEEISFVDENISMYVCGPTLYNALHIGNGRTLIVFDTLYRFFLKFCKKKITYVRNITDIDEKIIQKSQQSYKTPEEVVEENYKLYNKDKENLNLLTPNYEPFFTEYLPKMFDYIYDLIEKNYAYITHKNNIYFSIDKLEKYDFLQNIEDLNTSVRINNEDDKNNSKDFAIWKTTDGFGYNSPWGKGIPGWHMECVVMHQELLGNSFTLHGGGIDLCFPHHNNEIALCYGRNNTLCTNIWVHNGLLNIKEEKMSKSINNIILMKDIIKNKFDGDVFRYLYLSTHYRSPLNYSEDKLENSLKNIKKIREFKFKYNNFLNKFCESVYSDHLLEDFNTPSLLNYLHNKIDDFIQSIDLKEKQIIYTTILNTLYMLGFNLSIRTKLSEKEINKLTEQRWNLKKNKEFAESDKIRTLLHNNFIEIEDTSYGYIWFYV
ncbi:cysteine--tRNA ligase [Rickettsiales bacterium (ex Bugula neritina AB1)]|nr:cysteine--tRNA ligase [Rickettsiales bacterium (ex Bugula neritina AB1)]